MAVQRRRAVGSAPAPPRAPTRRKSAAFTLVELLVVVGIITILIAILLPALLRARMLPLRIQCQANLRSIGQALTMYTQRYRYYPALWGDVPGGLVNIWPTRLRMFMGGGQAEFYCPAQDERCKWPVGDMRPGPLAEARHTSFGYDLGERLLTYDWFSYGYNAAGVCSSGHHTLTGLGWRAAPYELAGTGLSNTTTELRANLVRA